MVREVLRITPVVPALFRRALVDIQLGGRLIPQVPILARMHVAPHALRMRLRRLAACMDLPQEIGDCTDRCALVRMQGWNVYVHVGAGVQKYNRDEFAPERWLQQQQPEASGAREGENSATEALGACPHRPEYSLPFGLGPRTCLGQHLVEAALRGLLQELVLKHTWQLQDDREQWSVFPTVKPKGGLQVVGFKVLDA